MPIKLRTHWPTILQGLKWMLKSDAPLLGNPKPGWRKLSWFAEFIANIPHYRRNTIETARLAVAARGQRPGFSLNGIFGQMHHWPLLPLFRHQLNHARPKLSIYRLNKTPVWPERPHRLAGDIFLK